MHSLVQILLLQVDLEHIYFSLEIRSKHYLIIQMQYIHCKTKEVKMEDMLAHRAELARLRLMLQSGAQASSDRTLPYCGAPSTTHPSRRSVSTPDALVDHIIARCLQLDIELPAICLVYLYCLVRQYHVKLHRIWQRYRRRELLVHLQQILVQSRVPRLVCIGAPWCGSVTASIVMGLRVLVVTGTCKKSGLVSAAE